MNSRSWGWIGAISLILGIILLITGIAYQSGIQSYLDKNYQSKGNGIYTCPDARTTYDTIREDVSPDAQTEYQGSFYLRYPNNMLTISTTASGCEIRLEDNQRYNSGHFIFLGTGFRPGSPSNSSGGTGGSNFGAK